MNTQAPGWQNERRRNFESIMTGAPVKEDLVADGWTEAFRLLFGSLRDKAPSKWRMAMWAITSVASKQLYQQGLKTYLTNKATQYMNLAEEMELADYLKMEQVWARRSSSRRPGYSRSAKAITDSFVSGRFHDEYLPTFNLPNVTLVNTEVRVYLITKDGIVFDGKEYAVDCIIFATGFEVGIDYSRRAAIKSTA